MGGWRMSDDARAEAAAFLRRVADRYRRGTGPADVRSKKLRELDLASAIALEAAACSFDMAGPGL